MKFFEAFGDNISYEDILQLDGAFAVTHVNYGRSPLFNGTDGKDWAERSRKGSSSSVEKVEDVLSNLRAFNGVEKNCTGEDQKALWENFWLASVWT